MSKLISLLLIALLSFSFCKLKKNKCVSLGGDCDLFHLCCGDFRCRDYRCSTAETEDNKLEYAPKGFKCDWFNPCTENYYCEHHRCVLDKKKLQEAMQSKPDYFK